MNTRPSRLIAAAFFSATVFAGFGASAQENMTPAIWIDPDGCEHWVIDDGAEGYMSPHLRRDGTPVCRTKNFCGALESDVLFPLNGAKVSKTGRSRIENLLNASPARAYIIAGHTDNDGSDEYNMKLSSARAKAVADIVRDLGGPINDVVGFGESRPRASNDTKAGRAANRRVDLICLR